MIELSADAVAAHPLMSQLKNPPTHAKAISIRHARSFASVVLPVGSAQQGNFVDAIYAFGAIDASGAFIPSALVPAVTVAIGLTPPVASADATTSVTFDDVDPAQQARAIANLIGAGVVPTPGAPHQATSVPAKQADSFRECDLDAYVSFYHHRLRGAVATTSSRSV